MIAYDITRTIHPDTAVWPGDARYRVQTMLSLADGDSVNLTTLTLSPHTGTHADAYFHFKATGAHPATMSLEPYIGKARVISVNKRDGALLPEDFPVMDWQGVTRVLIHSHVSDLPDDQWSETFPYLSVELIAWLAEMDVVLVGMDSPSVDAFDSVELPCHHALKAAGMVNLELLNLCGVPDGDYELIALPLKLGLTCGSPVRAILRRL